ncbi:MAG: calcium/sodium antiporter [Anaerolineae bacterium]|nr:calcium/sodium antiporter [Anaerolineae bacterium]
MLLDIGYIVVGIIGLVWGGNWLVTGASRLAESFGIPRLIVGLTIVAFGTSAPELLVNLSSVFSGSTDLALGNVVGSNIVNIGFILGVAGFIAPIMVQASLLRREIPIMIAVAILAFVLSLDNELGQVDGIILVVLFIAFTVLMVWLALKDKTAVHAPDVSEFPQEEIVSINRALEAGRLVAGLIILVVGANLTVTGAINIATALGVSQLVIGVTLVAVGTSLPELMASLIAAMRKESDLAIGNVVGSNIFNILMILGTTSVLKPVPVPASALQFDFLVMIAFSVVLLPLAWTNRKLARWECGLFIAGYVGFVVITLIR